MRNPFRLIRDLFRKPAMIGTPPSRRPTWHDPAIPWAAFHPLGTQGGYNAPDGRIVVESGLFNFDLLREDYGEEAAKLYADSDVTSRLDAIIAHEYEEHRHGGIHVEALKHAPSTELPITDRAREIARAMQEGWRGR
jgi:hypothetical protein